MVIAKFKNPESQVRELIDEVMKKHGFRHHYEVADYFGITAQTLSGWFKNDTIPHKHLLTIEKERDTSSYKKNLETENNSNNKIIQLLINRGKIIFFISLVFTSISFIYFSLFAPPVFTANSSVIPVSDNGSDLSGLSGAAAQMGLNFPVNNQNTIAWDELFFEILRSNGIKRKLLKEKFLIDGSSAPEDLNDILVKQLNLINKSANNQNLLIKKHLKDRIRISKTRFSPLINIEIDAYKARLASDMINRLIRISNDMQINIKTKQMGQKRIFIEERIKEVKVDLALAESRLKSFQERNRRPNKSPSLLLEESRLARDVTLQNNLYLTLKTQYEEAKIEEVERTPMVEIVDEPVPPIEQAGPQVLINTIMTAVLSFLFLFIIYFIKETFNPIFV